MARLVTLATLRSRVKQRANVEVASNSALYTAAELDDNINEGIAKLYDLVIAQQDQPYYLSQFPFSTSNAKDTYVIGAGGDIPITNFYKGKGLDVNFGQNIIASARPFMWGERNRFKWYPTWIYSQPVFYLFVGKADGSVANSGNDAIKLLPSPGGNFSCVLWFYPIIAPLVNAGDTFDGINGFEEYAVLDAAIKLLLKQERFDHAQALMGRQAEERLRVETMLTSHDAENPARVQDITLNDGWTGYPNY